MAVNTAMTSSVRTIATTSQSAGGIVAGNWLHARQQRRHSTALFAEDATYSCHPFDEQVAGRAVIVESWLKDPDPPGTYEGQDEPVAIKGDIAVVNGRSCYFKDSTRSEQTKEWDNIFVIRFDKDGRRTSFRELYVARRGQAGD